MEVSVKHIGKLVKHEQLGIVRINGIKKDEQCNRLNYTVFTKMKHTLAVNPTELNLLSSQEMTVSPIIHFR
jgi:hypothetical protein